MTTKILIGILYAIATIMFTFIMMAIIGGDGAKGLFEIIG